MEEMPSSSGSDPTPLSAFDSSWARGVRTCTFRTERRRCPLRESANDPTERHRTWDRSPPDGRNSDGDGRHQESRLDSEYPFPSPARCHLCDSTARRRLGQCGPLVRGAWWVDVTMHFVLGGVTSAILYVLLAEIGCRASMRGSSDAIAQLA